MKTDTIESLLLALGLASVLGGMATGACASAPKLTADQTLDAERFAAELEACIATSSTKEEWHACHCKIDARYGRRCPFTLDAGGSHERD